MINILPYTQNSIPYNEQKITQISMESYLTYIHRHMYIDIDLLSLSSVAFKQNPFNKISWIASTVNYRVFTKPIPIYHKIITCVPLVGYIMEYCVIKIDAFRWLSERCAAWFMASSLKKSLRKSWENMYKKRCRVAVENNVFEMQWESFSINFVSCKAFAEISLREFVPFF